MKAIDYIKSLHSISIEMANERLANVCGIQCFFECGEPNIVADTDRDVSEYGDWQTSLDLALKVCRLLKIKGLSPKVIVEPTCGKGSFILAAIQTFDEIEDIYGVEICPSYLEELKLQILQYYLDNPDKRRVNIHLYCHNIFEFDLSVIKKSVNHREILVVGNPPWVTNSKLGVINGDNVPVKKNFKRLTGLDALTGKSNFDIAEYISRLMIDLLVKEKGYLAFLLKGSVIKNIVYSQQKDNWPMGDIQQYDIDSAKEFGVSVAAALFYCSVGDKVAKKQCVVHDFYTGKKLKEYGWIDKYFVSDIALYQQYAIVDGVSPLVWWSGIKHDCAKVMELSCDNGVYINGLGEVVDIEDDVVYPLIKSSDVKGGIVSTTRKYLIVTQESISDDTERLKDKCPKTYQYLLDHATYLDCRGSRIYKGRPRFCMFGVGSYSFKPYKIVISGLYKRPCFTFVRPIAGKSVMVDDTCYMLGFDSLENAIITQAILDSEPIQTFIRSVAFMDSKRVINKDLLMRINLKKSLEIWPCVDVDQDKILKYKIWLEENCCL